MASRLECKMIDGTAIKLCPNNQFRHNAILAALEELGTDPFTIFVSIDPLLQPTECAAGPGAAGAGASEQPSAPTPAMAFLEFSHWIESNPGRNVAELLVNARTPVQDVVHGVAGDISLLPRFLSLHRTEREPSLRPEGGEGPGAGPTDGAAASSASRLVLDPDLRLIDELVCPGDVLQVHLSPEGRAAMERNLRVLNRWGGGGQRGPAAVPNPETPAAVLPGEGRKGAAGQQEAASLDARAVQAQRRGLEGPRPGGGGAGGGPDASVQAQPGPHEATDPERDPLVVRMREAAAAGRFFRERFTMRELREACKKLGVPQGKVVSDMYASVGKKLGAGGVPEDWEQPYLREREATGSRKRGGAGGGGKRGGEGAAAKKVRADAGPADLQLGPGPAEEAELGLE